MPCQCNPCGGIDEPPKLSPIAPVTLDKERPAALMGRADWSRPPPRSIIIPIEEEALMRMAITILSFVGAVGIASCQSAGAVAINAATMKEAASAASTVQQARFYGYRTRHYVVKCYREVVIGPYVCRRFYRW